MKTKNSTFITLLYKYLNQIYTQRHLYAIRISFISTMPIMLIGAYAIIVNQLPITLYQTWMANLFGKHWQILGQLAFNSTTQIVTLMVAFLICMNLIKWHNLYNPKQLSPGVCGTIALSCYMIASLPLENIQSLHFNIIGINGLFTSIIISTLVGEIILKLCGKNNAPLFSNDSQMDSLQSFELIKPAMIIIGSFLLLRLIFIIIGTNKGLNDLIFRLIYHSYENHNNSLIAIIRYNFSTHLMWLFGIHGNNVLDKIAKITFAPPNLFTKSLLDVFVYMGGYGTTLALLISLVIFGNKRKHRTLLRYSLPNAIFNINEPLLFCTPIVLNPFYAVPFILTPMVMLLTTTFAMYLNLIPYTIIKVSWVTPIFISGYMATGSIAGSILQLINLICAVLIYAPFVRLSEKMSEQRFYESYQSLLNMVLNNYIDPSKLLVKRMDNIGAVAREIATQLNNAMEKGEVFLNYQPIVNVKLNKTHGVEALLRWHHPKHGPIHPMLIIALAEETNQISKLGLWILEKAIYQRAQWNKEGLGDFYVAVNASTKQLSNPEFYHQILSLLDEYMVPPKHLQIEITETTALTGDEITSKNLEQLHASGIAIAMDDFGVGHSSLLYLKNHPISTLKIDRSLSQDIVQNSFNFNIITTIYKLCSVLNIDTIIEHVDNPEQLEKLISIGAFLVQGYLYSPPLSAGQISDFINSLKEKNHQMHLS